MSDNRAIHPYHSKRIGIPPKQLYKYHRLDDNFKDALKNSYLWLSTYDELNDIHEGNIDTVKFNPTFDQVCLLAKRSGHKLLTPEIIRMYMGIPAKMEELFEGFREALIEARASQGICCFSTTSTNAVLWGNYADKSRGVCLEFEFPESAESFFTLEVDYREEFTSYDYFDEDVDAMLFMLLAKSAEWKIEKERRIISMEKGRLVYDKSWLKAIIFGAKIDPKSIQEIQAIIEQNPYPQLSLRKAVPSTNYSFNILPY